MGRLKDQGLIFNELRRLFNTGDLCGLADRKGLFAESSSDLGFSLQRKEQNRNIRRINTC